MDGGIVGASERVMSSSLRLTKELKTEYAAHQLQRPAGIWWSHHRTTFPANTPITWEMFTTAF
jgi:hypothetical protein